MFCLGWFVLHRHSGHGLLLHASFISSIRRARMHKCRDGTTGGMQEVEQCRSNFRGCYGVALEVTNAGIHSASN